MPCVVCMSPHRTEYERLRLEKNWTYPQLSKYAKEKYNEDILPASFSYHFRMHCQPYIERMKKASKYRREVVKAQIKKDIMIAKQLTKNLEICANKIQEKLKQENLSPEEEKLLLSYLAETRLIIEELLRWSEKLELEEEKEPIVEKIINCMRDFPPELIEKFLERWEEYDKRQSKESK